MVRIPLRPDLLERYESIRSESRYQNEQLTVTLNLGYGSVAKEVAAEAVRLVIEKGLLQEAWAGVGRSFFGGRPAHLLTLKGPAVPVALAILALNSSVDPKGKDRER